MKIRIKTNAQKELENRNQITESVIMIRDARKSVEELSKNYNNWVDEAAMLGEDDYSNQLIEDQVELEEFSRALSFLEVRIMESATTATVFNNLSKLPLAMDACKSLLKRGVNMATLGKQMASFKKMLDNARTQIKDLRAELSNAKNPVYTELFGKKISEDPKITARIAAKKQERELRIASLVGKGMVYPSPVITDNDVKEVDHGIDDITAMIDEENKKN